MTGRLRQLGTSLSLDDFGTGYSSLLHLQQIPLDAIKIDITFIADVDRDPEAERFLRAFLALGRDLGLAVTAEGVEREEQAATPAPPRLPERPGLPVRPARTGLGAGIGAARPGCPLASGRGGRGPDPTQHHRPDLMAETAFDYSNLSGRPAGAVVRALARVLPGVRQVQAPGRPVRRAVAGVEPGRLGPDRAALGGLG